MPDPALTRATQSARRIQPTTSLATPADSTMIPTDVRRSFNSVRMRQRTGNAVIAIATPMKSMYTPNLIGTVPGSSLNSV